MDLGIIIPVAVTTGLGLWFGARWARRVMYPLLTGYTCLAVSVAAMAAVMNLNADPDASLALAGGFIGFALVFILLTVGLYRPLFHHTNRSSDRSSSTGSGLAKTGEVPGAFRVAAPTQPRDRNVKEPP